MRKYTYHDWLEGKLILNYDCYIPSGKEPRLVMWDDFNDEDVLLIKEKQKEIFDERVISLLEKYKSAFQKRMKASRNSAVFSEKTVNQITSILEDEMPQGWKARELVETNFWNLAITGENLLAIKQSMINNIDNGDEFNYTFINSPTMDYQRPEVNPQIYAYTLFLFRNWIKSTPSQQSETKTDKLSLKQMALICAYKEIQITRENANVIAANYGFTAKSSGEKLYQDYIEYCTTAKRIAMPIPCTPRKIKNKIKLIESVINHLSDDKKERAIDELKILTTVFENEYQ